MSKPHPFDWRLPRAILPLENFDFPEAHVRSNFNHDVIWGLTAPQMAGSRVQMTPEEIRDAIRDCQISDDTKAYLHEVFQQCGGFRIKLLFHSCGASLYELARTMISCEVRHPFVAEWMNCRSPCYQPDPRGHGRWWLDRIALGGFR